MALICEDNRAKQVLTKTKTRGEGGFTNLSTTSTTMVRSCCVDTASPFGKFYGRCETYLWFTPQADKWYRHLHVSFNHYSTKEQNRTTDG
eukprot:4362287-Amphidinium_carterae.1